MKPIWILLKQEAVSDSGISWAVCKSASRSRQIAMPASHHSSFLQAGCPSCRPTNSVEALKANQSTERNDKHASIQYWRDFVLTSHTLETRYLSAMMLSFCLRCKQMNSEECPNEEVKQLEEIQLCTCKQVPDNQPKNDRIKLVD